MLLIEANPATESDGDRKSTSSCSSLSFRWCRFLKIEKQGRLYLLQAEAYPLVPDKLWCFRLLEMGSLQGGPGRWRNLRNKNGQGGWIDPRFGWR